MRRYWRSGPQGIQGPIGNTGPAGPAGPQGIQGPQGATGGDGPQGIAGNDGADGNGIVSATNNGDGTFTLTFDDGTTFTTDNLTGPQGDTGDQGPQGETGPAGPQVRYWCRRGKWKRNCIRLVNNGDGTFTLTFDDGTFTTDDLTG